MTGAPVRLAPAYSWQCPCGAKNWEEGVRLRKYPPDERLADLAPHEIKATAEGIHTWPTAVRCRSCGEAFAAEGG